MPSNIVFFLPFAGTIPFLACAILAVLEVSVVPLIGHTRLIVSVYAIVIVSFMAGVHWGQYVASPTAARRYLLITSNIIAIVIWLSYLILSSFNVFLCVLVACFLLLLAIDKILLSSNIILARYFYVRCIVTFIVIISLIITGWKL